MTKKHKKEKMVEITKDDEKYLLGDSEVEVASSAQLTVYVIGDLHFQNAFVKEGMAFIQACIADVQQRKPSMIVVLGDVLHYHDLSKNIPFKMTEYFFEKLSEIAPTYVIIGNHDMANPNQFLTENHFFGPFKKWKNLHIIDKPTWVSFHHKSFVMCPYVPKGRFIEALDLLTECGELWCLADLVFSHVEVQGCIKSKTPTGENVMSEDSDVWDENNPTLISGHIHHPHQFKNVIMVGSAIQYHFEEGADKRNLLINFSPLEDTTESTNDFTTQDIHLNLKKKIKITMNIDEIDTFDFSIAENNHIKLEIIGSNSQFKLFRRSPLYTKLNKSKVRIAFHPMVDKSMIVKDGNICTNFVDIVHTLVEQQNNPLVVKAHQTIVPLVHA